MMLSKCYIYTVFALAAQTKIAFAEDWSISFTEGSTAAVTDADEVKILQEYVVGNEKNVVVEVFDFDCAIQATKEVFVPTFTFSAADGEKFKLDVTVDVAEDKIMGSSYWTADSGQLKLCVKVELWEGAQAVSFYETQVELEIEMTVNFDDTVSVTKLVPASETTATNLWYDIAACLCYSDDTSCATTPKIIQNEQFSLCLYPTHSEIAIVEVQSVNLEQDGIVVSSPVTASTTDALSRLAVNGTVHTLTTWSLSTFYAEETPNPVTASGVLKLAFIEPQAERRLRIVDSEGRRILASDTGSFEIKLELEYDPEYAESSGERMIYGFTSVLLFLSVLSLSF